MITIITSYGAYRLHGTSWARDGNRDVHVYDDDTTLVSVDANAFVAAFPDLTDEEHERLADAHDVVDVGVVNPSDAPETTTTETNTNNA